jgi:hypothetical protein
MDVETKFKDKQVARKKCMAGELNKDKRVDEPIAALKLKCTFVVIN